MVGSNPVRVYRVQVYSFILVCKNINRSFIERAAVIKNKSALCVFLPRWVVALAGRIGHRKRITAIFGTFIVLLSSLNPFWLAAPVYATPLGNLAGYWKLDETSTGSTVADSSGYGNNLSVTGSPQPSTQVPSAISFPDSRSLSLNGSSTLDVANPTGFNYGTSPRSMSSWIYPTSTPAGDVEVPVAYGSCAYNNVQTNIGKAFGYFIDSSMDIHFWGCGSDFNTNTTVTLNTWSNITITYNGATVTVYLNGNQIASQGDTLVSQGASTPEMDIGSAYQIDTTAHYFTGNIDDVRIYNRALSPTEVSELVVGNNTTATWTGGISNSWANPSNWNIGAVPDSYTNIVVGNGTYQPALTTSTSLAGLTIDSGDNLNLAGQNLTMNDSGNFTNNGTVILQGSEVLSGLANDTSGGTIEYDGSGTYTSLDFGDTYNSLDFNGSGSWTLNNPLIINKSLDIVSGTLSAGGNDVTVGGNWSNTGAYNADNNTVTLGGTNQTISGSTTFYNLAKTVSSADTLTFGASTTQTITNNLTLTGASNQLLTLKSSSAGTQWLLDPTRTYNLNYLAVHDGNNLGTTPLNPTNSTDNGDNISWFPPYKPVSLSPTSTTDGSYSSDSTPTISFNLSDSDTSTNVRYEVQVANNSSFTNPIVDYTSGLGAQGSYSFTIGQNTGSGSYTTGSSGQTFPGGNYYWRVQMIDNSGNSSGFTTANNGSTAFRVDTTPPTTPGAPHTTSPTTSTTPAWTWTDSTDSGSGLATTPYTVEWSTDPSFTNNVSSTTSQTNSLTLPANLIPGIWYVRVKAKDIVGNVSAYSAAGLVTVTIPSSPSSNPTSTTPNSQSDTGTDKTASSTSQTSSSPASTSTPDLSQTILLNNYTRYTSGSGEQLDLNPNQVVYFNVGSQSHSATLDQVGSDYVVLTLKSTPRNVTIQTGDTDEYDVNGDGKPDIAITLRGTRNGVALLTFTEVKTPAVQVNLVGVQHSAKDSSLVIWIIIFLVGVATGIWFVARRKHQRKGPNNNLA